MEEKLSTKCALTKTPGMTRTKIESSSVSIVFRQSQSGTSIPKHNHEYDEFIFVPSGAKHLEWCEQPALEVKPADCFWAPSQIDHSANWVGECFNIGILIGKSVVDEALAIHKLSRPKTTIRFRAGIELQRLLAFTTSTNGIHYLASENLSKSLALLLAAELVENASKKTVNDQLGTLDTKALREIDSFIQERITAAISLGDLSEVVHLSPFHFTRLFKNATGSTPLKYVLSVRLSVAKNLLAQKELTIADVAQMSGFSNRATFAKAFKRTFKISPSRYKERLAP
jgi:AraC family transcriptional regulator